MLSHLSPRLREDLHLSLTPPRTETDIGVHTHVDFCENSRKQLGSSETSNENCDVDKPNDVTGPRNRCDNDINSDDDTDDRYFNDNSIPKLITHK